MRALLRCLLLPCVVLAALAGPSVFGDAAWAQVPRTQVPRGPAPGGDVIRDITVQGTQRIEPSTVMSYLTVHPGDRFDQTALDASLTSLFRTGLFADVTLRQEGSTLVVQVVENPIINRIAFEGNRRVESSSLQSEIQLRPRVVYTRSRVQSDVERILEVYRRSGRFASSVNPQIIRLDQNRVDLVFEIDEGPQTTVRSINFIGNHAFSNRRLREEIQTRESRWWAIFATTDTYDPDRLASDREQLRRFYLTQGYADFRVISAVAELTPDNEGFYITFTVDEGERYQFGTVDVVSHLPDLNVDPLRSEVESREGDWYSSTAVEQSIDSLTGAVEDQQYAFVDVRPLVNRDRDAHLINITYEINEGPRVFVERIDISGNVRTIDRVIRREMALVEGDPFNRSRLRLSEQRLRNLGFFERVTATPEPGSAPDRTVINVQVQEQSTGELSLGAGYSTVDGILGDVTLRERNFLGRGQDLRLTARLSFTSQEFDLSFTEPYFMDRNVSAGFDLFRITRDRQDVSSYDEFTVGFGLRMGYPLSEHWRQTLRYSLFQRTIENVDSGASLLIREQEGTTLNSSVGQQLTFDNLDSRIDPTSGQLVRFGVDLAGLGGDVHYVRTTLAANAYFPIWTNDLVLGVSGEVGHVAGLGESVRINDRFFVGGTNMRGFERGGLGPRDGVTGDSLGGNTYGVGTVELTFPLGLPEELGIRGRTFTDVGTVTSVDDVPAGVEVQDTGALRVAVGAGVSWSSPFGPIRLDLAYPVMREDFDRTQAFRFSFGTRF